MPKRMVYQNEKYLSFLRKLPCAISGRCGNIHAHHVGGKGLGGGKRNDYLAVPLDYDYHVGKGHITTDLLEHQTKMEAMDLAHFYLMLYAEHLEGRYEPEDDMECGYMTLRKKMLEVVRCQH